MAKWVRAQPYYTAEDVLARLDQHQRIAKLLAAVAAAR
jgi:hypothetical protein